MPDAIISLNQTLYGVSAANVVCFNNFEEDETFLQDFADKIRASFAFYATQHMQQFWTLDNITVSFLLSDSVDYSVEVGFTAGALAGELTADGLPGQNALLISTSYVGSRPNRGRIYFMGLTENDTANGGVDSQIVQDFEDMVTDWKTGITVEQSSVFLRILRRPSAVFPTYISNSVSLVSGNPSIRTQRRRARP